MRRGLRTFVSVIVAAQIGLVFPCRARAANQECFTASTDGQKLALDGKLRAAREKFAVCAAASCPAEVADDCKERLAKVDADVGSIVVGVTDSTGAKITAARVLVDGEAVATAIDGKPIDVDPGAHDVRVEPASGAPMDEHVEIARGAKSTPVTFVLAAPPPPPPPPAATTTSNGGGIPTASWILGGVGVVGLACFAGFGIAALHQSSDLHSRAPGTYTQDDVDSLKQKRLLADVSLGVGVVSLGLATVLWLTRPNDDPKKDASIVDVHGVAGGAIATWSGAF